MMNIMQVQDDLKNFSQEQLIKEIQRPSGMAPQFLVLSEINRRQRVKQDVNARMAQQQPTVAEEAIASAGVPQGGLADMSQALAPKSASALSTGVGTSMPMAMQSGGFLKTPDEIDEELDMFTDPDSMDFSRMSLEEMAEFAKKMKGLQPTKMASGGLTEFGNEIRQSLGQQIEPYLEQIENEAESKFNIDLDMNQPDNIVQLPGPRIPTYVDRGGVQRPNPIDRNRTQIGIGGKGMIRPSVTDMAYPSRLIRRYAEGGPVYMQEGGTLGLRQNNPGNIRPGAGFIGETGQGSGYATFQNPLFGGRALARLLSTYKNKHGISNVDSLIDRYAPSGDNTMESRTNYKGFIANKLGVGKDDEIDLDDDNTKLGVMKAIVEFENRNENPYSDQEYNLMIQSAKMDDEDKVSDLLTNREVIKDNAGGLDLISSAAASQNLKSMIPQGQNFGARNTDGGGLFSNVDMSKVYTPPMPRFVESMLIRSGKQSIVDDPLEFQMGLEGKDISLEELQNLTKKQEAIGRPSIAAAGFASTSAEKIQEKKEQEKIEQEKKKEDDKKKTEPAVFFFLIIIRF